ncbi:hypothetical protein ACFSWE_04035 [Leucobacter albus]|uniref:pEK499-p136 HEPN domain-containing protein n=1 Tax=Leucobacter albus TaxID=272210 RepID=A0ABW3TNT4_9MICO
MSETLDERKNRLYPVILERTVALMTGFAHIQEMIKAALQQRLADTLPPSLVKMLADKVRSDKDLRFAAVALSEFPAASPEANEFNRRWDRVKKVRDMLAHGMQVAPLWSDEENDFLYRPLYKEGIETTVTSIELDSLNQDCKAMWSWMLAIQRANQVERQ